MYFMYFNYSTTSKALQCRTFVSSLNEVSGKHVVIGEAFPRLSDSCGICFYVKNTGFLVRGSMARKMRNMLK